jgi:aspartate aminotransferase-like enzyme
MAKNHTPWTPAVSLFYGLEEALDLILAEGLAAGVCPAPADWQKQCVGE